MPGEITAAFLYAQLQNLEEIQTRRKYIWNKYQQELDYLTEKGIVLPNVPEYATNNGHLFYLILTDIKQRKQFIEHLKSKGIMAVFHYQSLHKSLFYLKQNYHDTLELPMADHYSDRLLRLPLFFSLTEQEQIDIINEINSFFNK